MQQRTHPPELPDVTLVCRALLFSYLGGERVERGEGDVQRRKLREGVGREAERLRIVRHNLSGLSDVTNRRVGGHGRITRTEERAVHRE